jgi:hypothetical protein
LNPGHQWGRKDNAVVVLDPDFNPIDEIETVGLSNTGFHDFLINDNDELIMVAYDGSIRDLTAIGLSAQETFEFSVVQVIDRATRQVLFEWNSWGKIAGLLCQRGATQPELPNGIVALKKSIP